MIAVDLLSGRVFTVPPSGGGGGTGSPGADGSVWRDGTGAPSNGLGINGDYYLNNATGDVYHKAAGAYSIVTNIKGADGADGVDGTNGTNGSVWRDGTGAPSNGLGVNGDYYLNDANGDVYLKAAGTYSVVTNIKGATGSTGATGATGATGPGVPTGGTAGQTLTKIDSTNFNTQWSNPASGSVAIPEVWLKG